MQATKLSLKFLFPTIRYVGFQYVDRSGNLILSPVFGYDDGTSFAAINVDFERNEYITGMTGEYGATSLHSLTFETNQKKYGPFGLGSKSGVGFEIRLGDGDLHSRFSWDDFEELRAYINWFRFQSTRTPNC